MQRAVVGVIAAACLSSAATLGVAAWVYERDGAPRAPSSSPADDAEPQSQSTREGVLGENDSAPATVTLDEPSSAETQLNNLLTERRDDLTLSQAAEAYAALGQAHLARDDHDDANTALTAALALGGLEDESEAAASVALGRVKLALGDVSEGLAILEPAFRSVDLSPADERMMAKAYIADGQNWAARSALTRAAEQETEDADVPSLDTLRLQDEVMAALGLDEDREAVLTHLVAAEPDQIAHRRAYAELLLSRGEQDGARAILAEAFASGAFETGEDHERLAQLHVAAGDHAAAAEVLEAGKRTGRIADTAQIALARAAVLAAADLHDEALAVHRAADAAGLYAGDAEATLAYIAAWSQYGDGVSAAMRMEQAIRAGDLTADDVGADVMVRILARAMADGGVLEDPDGVLRNPAARLHDVLLEADHSLGGGQEFWRDMHRVRETLAQAAREHVNDPPTLTAYDDEGARDALLDYVRARVLAVDPDGAAGGRMFARAIEAAMDDRGWSVGSQESLKALAERLATGTGDGQALDVASTVLAPDPEGAGDGS